jgi:uncharacterized protein (DUF2336 family)
MTGTMNDVLEQLKTSVSRRSAGEQGRIIQQVANLFSSDDYAYSAVQFEFLDRVMMQIIDQVDEAVRIYLSETFASAEAAPRQVVRRLAGDDEIRVAGPVLARSNVLDEDFLTESARTKSQQHLLAISGRHGIGPRVTDVLIHRGNGEVILTLAQNEGAGLSDRGSSAIVVRARDNGQLAEALCRRSDIPRQKLLELIEKASEDVRQHLEAQGEIHAREILELVRSASKKLKDRSLEMSSAYENARERIAGLQRTGGLSESHILSFARERKFEEVVIALSEMFRLLPADIERIVAEGASDRLLILLRAFGLSWSCVREIVLMTQSPPSPKDRLEQLKTRYQSLPRESAAKTLQFYQLRLRARAGEQRAS